MSEAQHASYFRWWAAACAAQGWDKLSSGAREQQRKLVHLKVFGEPVSAKDIDRDQGFTRIISEFKSLADHLQGTKESLFPAINKARQMRYRIRELCACLAVYVEHPDAYLKTILRNRFHIVENMNHLDDLDAEDRGNNPHSMIEYSELRKVLMTLNRCVHGLRKKSGDTIAEMEIKAQQQTNPKPACDICSDLA